MTDPANFYEQLPPILALSAATNPQNYRDVPEDWYIAITDVEGSTVAIEAGRYKDVNAIAAASITAVLNVVERVAIPFVFGGDGATLVIPPETVPQVSRALVATRQLAANAFGLTLRIGVVPVRDVLSAGYRLRVAKLRYSENFEQALFTGGGVRYAEELVKQPATARYYAITVFEDTPITTDFSGFECRWNKIKGSRGEVVSLLVTATCATSTENNRVYADILQTIDAVYGAPDERHPISIRNMRLALLPAQFRTEALVRRGSAPFKELWRLAVSTFKGRVAMWFNIQGWGGYKPLFIRTTDHEKFDDALRMTISGTRRQSTELRNVLEERRQRGELVYGIHHTTHALVTCIVFDHFGRQVHFVDGANGGYALAAKEMKAQIAALRGDQPAG